MLTGSKKDLLEMQKWSKKNSPIAYLVLSMNGKWDCKNPNAENVIASFVKYWPDARAELVRQGRKSIANLDIPTQNGKPWQALHLNFVQLMLDMPQFLDQADEYELLESFSRDMRAMISWEEPQVEDTFTGAVIYALDKQERFDEAFEMFEALKKPVANSIVIVYGRSLLDRCDTKRAEAVLEPYRGKSTDERILGQLTVLDNLKRLRGEV